MRRLSILSIIAVAALAGCFVAFHRNSEPTHTNATNEKRWNADNTTRLVIWRQYGYDTPAMEFCTGKKACRTINNTAPITLAQQPYYITTPHPKELRISPAPSKITYLDPNPKPLEPGTYESTHPAIRYGGAWIHQHREGPSGGEVHTAMDPASTVSFEFEGTGIELGVVFYDDRRKANLCVDSVCRELELFSHSLEWQQPFLVYGLPPGKHQASLRLTAGKAMDLDWVRVIGPLSPFSMGKHAPTDPRWFTTAGWENGHSHALSAGAAFSFTGKAVGLTFPTGPDAGEMMLCLDGQCQIEDLFSRMIGERTIHVIAKPGTHHVVIQKGASRSLSLPHLQVF